MPAILPTSGLLVKDTLVEAEDHRRRNVLLLSRRGKKIIEPNMSFSRAGNSKFYFDNTIADGQPAWVTTDEAGTVYSIDLKGNVREKTINAYSPEHSFMLVDMNADGVNEFVFTDKNVLDIYNLEGASVFKKSFRVYVL